MPSIEDAVTPSYPENQPMSNPRPHDPHSDFAPASPVPAASDGDGYSVAHAGPAAEWGRYSAAHPLAGTVHGKLFFKTLLAGSGAEISFGTMPAGRPLPFLHHHKGNEEYYVFVSGEGEMTLDGTLVPVREGSVVRIAPRVVRGFRNTGAVALNYIVVQAKEGSLENWTVSDGAGDGPSPWN